MMRIVLPSKYAAASNDGVGVAAAGTGVAVGGAGVGVGTPGAKVAVAVGTGVAVATGADVGVGSSPPQAASTTINAVPRINPLDHADHRIPIIPPRITSAVHPHA